MARSRQVAAALTAWDAARARAGTEHFIDNGSFLEFEDRLLLDEIPRADYHHGGTFFFGSSSLKWSLKTWELPDEPSMRFRNYGIGATNHRMQLQFLQYLTRYHGFLDEGAGKTCIVFGAGWTLGCDIPPSSYFGPLWERHGLYEYDAVGGIRPASMCGPVRSIRLERARCSSFLGGNLRRARKAAMGAVRRVSADGRLTDPRVIRKRAELLAGTPGWQEPLHEQVKAFVEFIDFVQARHGEMVVVILPMRQVFRDMAMPAAYAAQVRAVCEAKCVPIVDLSGLLPDTEFWDTNHCDFRGLEKTHAALMEAARITLPEKRAAEAVRY